MGGRDAPEAVLAIARQHVDGLPALPVGFERRHTQGQRVPAGWYFDYGVAKVLPNRDGPGSGIGGAAGFLVRDDGRVVVVSFPMIKAVRQGEALPDD